MKTVGDLVKHLETMDQSAILVGAGRFGLMKLVNSEERLCQSEIFVEIQFDDPALSNSIMRAEGPMEWLKDHKVVRTFEGLEV